MANSGSTPCGALFDVMKRYCGMSYKEFAGLILSNKPLSDGRSPASRVGDRTWVSRFVVHAPAGQLQERLFCDYGVAALRVMTRLRTRRRGRLSSEQVIDILRDQGICGMAPALASVGEDISPMRNVLDRLAGSEGYSVDERSEVAMVLFIAAGCAGSARKAAAYALEYAQSSHGDGLAATPAVMMRSGDAAEGLQEPLPLALGLVRVCDGYVKGSPHWVSPECAQVEIGAFALGENDIADVGGDVSGRHAQLGYEGGTWRVRDVGSKNGTSVMDGATGQATELERDGAWVELHAGDTLRLGASTSFVAIEGLPES